MNDGSNVQQPDQEYAATCGCVFDRLGAGSFLILACPFAVSMTLTPNSGGGYVDSAYHVHLEQARGELARVLDHITATDTSRSP